MRYILCTLVLLATLSVYAKDDDGIECQVISVLPKTGNITMNCPPAEIFTPLHIEIDAVPDPNWEQLAFHDLVKFRGLGADNRGKIQVKWNRSDKWFVYKTERFRFVKEKHGPS